jgi:hypothetical protein
MDKSVISKQSFWILSGLGGVVGVVLIMVSFVINSGPPPGTTTAELIKFGQQNYANILWGAWLQAVGPVLIVLFAFALVQLAGPCRQAPLRPPVDTSFLDANAFLVTDHTQVPRTRLLGTNLTGAAELYP